MPSNDVFCARQSRKFAGATANRPNRGSTSNTITSRSCSGNGSGRSIAALTMLNTELDAPIPNASVRTATSVNPGAFAIWRHA